MAISAGGDTIKIYDMIAGKVLKTLVKTHHKTITCVHNYGQYLLTASIDGHLKVYDSNFNVSAFMTYTPSQLLSCALDDKVLAVGANDGLFSVNKFKTNSKSGPIFEAKKKVNPKRYFSEDVSDLSDKPIAKRKDSSDKTLVVKGVKKNDYFLPKHEELLKQFNHSLALNRVLKKNSGEPEVVVSFIQELMRRGSLKAALAGRTDKHLKPILEFLLKHIKDPRLNRILVDAALILTDVYMSQINRSTEIQSMFKKLSSVITSELNCMQQMLAISGQLSAIINSSVQ
jgi:U3 small nucleolar RNA-associated protein 15